jgi:hypothetical protein
VHDVLEWAAEAEERLATAEIALIMQTKHRRRSRQSAQRDGRSLPKTIDGASLKGGKTIRVGDL